MNEPTPGTLLGHYKIVRQLGKGGMGVVYEAVDQKLGRHVALKLLTEASRDSSAALERFWREARAASSLNHPGICTIHELNESAETPFIVMELLEGSSLEKLYRGQPMPYLKLIEIGTQLADALDAAHRKGILHRDIKPGNIFLTDSGQAKLLDFGLAKLEDAVNDSRSGLGPEAPTAVDPLTSSGSSVGTVAYMSPEQARAEPLDARSDLFSLGVVLYEMATGQHPFTGASTAVVFDQILNHAPIAPITLNAQLPVEFEGILNKTLEKDREIRCQSAAELRADLKRLQRNSSSGNVHAKSSSESNPRLVSATTSAQQVSERQSSSAISSANLSRRTSRAPIIALVALLLLAAAGYAAWHFLNRTQPFEKIAVNQVTNVGTIERLALSGDARFLAEVKNTAGQRTIWVRNTITNTDTQILGAFGNEYPGLTFSPDGNYLYFTRGTPQNNSLRALYVMPVFGGTPKQLITDIDSVISFAPDGNRLTYTKWTPDRKDQYSEVHLADKDGSNNQEVYTTMEQLGPAVWSPDGGRLAWIGSNGPARQALQILDISSKKVKTIAAPANIRFQNSFIGETNVLWMPDGKHLLALYLKPHTDYAQIGIIDAASGELRPLTNDVNSYSQMALSANGRTLATVLTNIDSNIAFYKPDGGAPLATTPLRVTPWWIAWANEDRLIFNIHRIAIGSVDRANGNVQNFDTEGITTGNFIATCPDGHILFAGFPKGVAEARGFRMNADGSNIVQLTDSGIARNLQCSPDSRQVFYSHSEGGFHTVSLWVTPLAGGTPKELLPSQTASYFQLSKDGKLAGYETTQTTGLRWKVLDVNSGRVVSDIPTDMSDISTSGSTVRFSPDDQAVVRSALRNGGRTLLYQPLDGSAPHTLIDPIQEAIFDFDWSPSGKQLAVLRVKSSSDIVLITDQSGKD